MIYEHRKKIREYEFSNVLKILGDSKGRRLLEIGAGAGWQAKEFAEQGFIVDAIDIIGSDYEKIRVWDVKIYDGLHLPFPANYFDAVYSSHVLICSDQLEEMQKEILRVLKPDGIAVHVLPSSAVALWSIFSHFPFVLKVIFRIIYPDTLDKRMLANTDKVKQSSLGFLARKFLIPHAVSKKWNFLQQAYFFNRRYWSKFFTTNGWLVKSTIPSKIFCTGNSLLGTHLSVSTRHFLSFILGSASTIFVLSKKK